MSPQVIPRLLFQIGLKQVIESLHDIGRIHGRSVFSDDLESHFVSSFRRLRHSHIEYGQFHLAGDSRGPVHSICLPSQEGYLRSLVRPGIRVLVCDETVYLLVRLMVEDVSHYIESLDHSVIVLLVYDVAEPVAVHELIPGPAGNLAVNDGQVILVCAQGSAVCVIDISGYKLPVAYVPHEDENATVLLICPVDGIDVLYLYDVGLPYPSDRSSAIPHGFGYDVSEMPVEFLADVLYLFVGFVRERS